MCSSQGGRCPAQLSWLPSPVTAKHHGGCQQPCNPFADPPSCRSPSSNPTPTHLPVVEGGIPHGQMSAAGGPSQPGCVLCVHREAVQALPGPCAGECHEVLVAPPLHPPGASVPSLSNHCAAHLLCGVSLASCHLSWCFRLCRGRSGAGWCAALASCLCMSSN